MVKLTQDEKDTIRDISVLQWWEEWFKADYSWDRLSQIDWHGWSVVEDKAAYDAYIQTYGLPEGCPNKACQVIPSDSKHLLKCVPTRSANLQDYWRDQEEHLEGHKGSKKYTIAHLPTHWPDGEVSWKADADNSKWQSLSDLIADRLSSAVRTEVDISTRSGRVIGQEKRANFRGCILPAIPSCNRVPQDDKENSVDPKLPSNVAGALHLILHQACILQPLNFNGSVFGSSADFRRVLFSKGQISFEGAHFSGGKADFRGAYFADGHTSFKGTHFSGGHAVFNGAKFLARGVNFRKAEFEGGDALFSSAYFSGGFAIFRNVNFSGGDTNFSRAQFLGGYATFKKSKFTGGKASFAKAKFSGGVTTFTDAKFSGGDALFKGAQFLGGDINFINTEFTGGKANFVSAHFLGGITNFGDAKFIHDCNFNYAHIEKSISFENAIFPPLVGSQNAFRGTQFLGPANFSRSKHEIKNGTKLSAEEMHFPFNAFAHANIKDQIILTERGEKAAQEEFDHALAFLEEACNTDENGQRESRYVALEQGCTTLKRAMENISDKNRAQRYFKFELLAREKRPSTPLTVKWFTKIYGWTANYGGSIVRPLWTLGAAWIVFAIIYGVNAQFIEVSTEGFFESCFGPLDFSATQIFRPFYIWSKASITGDANWLALYKNRLSLGGWLSIKLLATAQSFLSITMLFLFGLATKRKFQIS